MGMGMGLYTLPGVYVSSWIEMTTEVAMRFEVDRHNDSATLYFGTRDEYVLDLCQDNLDQVLELCTAAKRELSAPPADGH